ncbi:hypothetical protein GQ457_01G025000 [Hibiscus cannabinus]
MSPSLSESQTSSSSSSSSSSVSAEFKLYQAFIFSVPIFFAFILLFMFYLFYLRRRQADWSSLRMRTSPGLDFDLSMSTLITFVNGGFNRLSWAQERNVWYAFGITKQRINFNRYMHVAIHFTWIASTIWLANHTTCPLCRLSVLASPKALDKLVIIQAANIHESSHPVNRNGLVVQPVSQSFGEMQGVQPLEQTIGDARVSRDARVS